jgi:hypothetical protein
LITESTSAAGSTSGLGVAETVKKKKKKKKKKDEVKKKVHLALDHENTSLDACGMRKCV